MSSPAPACQAALAQATQKWPTRSRAADGIMGDPSHLARKSDHNLGLAYDLTHDPAAGVNTHTLADWLRLRCLMGQETRPTYIISKGRIASAERGWTWRTYNGANPHDHHMHVSIRTDKRDDVSPWWTRRPTESEFRMDAEAKAAFAAINDTLRLVIYGDKDQQTAGDQNPAQVGLNELSAKLSQVQADVAEIKRRIATA